MKHLTFFGLKEEPFRMTPDRDFFFPSAHHTSISEVVHYGLEQGEGFLVVFGEVGTGKTLLLRLLTARLSEKFTTALVISPNLTPKQLLLAILHDINVKTTGHESTAGLLHTLNDYLTELYRSGKKLVLIIDEAQNLPVESIEQLRILSNFETDKDKLVQIILVGQPELKDIIDSMLSLAMVTKHGQPKLQEVDLNDVVGRVLGLAEMECQKRDIEIERLLDPDLPVIEATTGELDQIFVNLVNNAIDAMDKGGTLTVHTAPVADGLEVHVQDTGKGIAAKDIGVANPAFDVTPHQYVSAIITEQGVARAPYTEALEKMQEK